MYTFVPPVPKWPNTTAHFCSPPPPPTSSLLFLTTNHRAAKCDIIATSTTEGAHRTPHCSHNSCNYISFPQTGENARDALCRWNPVVMQSENGTGYDISFHLTKSQPLWQNVRTTNPSTPTFNFTSQWLRLHLPYCHAN